MGDEATVGQLVDGSRFFTERNQADFGDEDAVGAMGLQLLMYVVIQGGAAVERLGVLTGVKGCGDNAEAASDG